MIAEIRLVSNSDSTARFWGAIFDVEPEDLGPDRWGNHSWRISPAVGPDIVMSTARTTAAITSVDMIVATDAGAPDRLREAGFEVAHDGSQAVDVNGCDNTVFLTVRHWDGISDVDWEEPGSGEELSVTAVTGRVDQIQTGTPGLVTKFLSAWFGVPADRQVPGVARFAVGGTLIRVSYTARPEKRWIPLGTADYPAAVARVESAGFAVMPSAGGQVAGHVELGGHVFLLVELHGEDPR
jgi:hypothetical protein